jgi:hypothetical protein
VVDLPLEDREDARRRRMTLLAGAYRRPPDADTVPENVQLLVGHADDDDDGPRRRDLGMPDVIAGLELLRERRDLLALGEIGGVGRRWKEQADERGHDQAVHHGPSWNDHRFLHGSQHRNGW